MAGDDPRRIVGQRQAAVDGGDQAVDRTAGIAVDEGEAGLVEEGVAHVEDIRLLPMDEGIAVRMRIGDMDNMQHVAVEMQRHAVRKGDDRQRALR